MPYPLAKGGLFSWLEARYTAMKARERMAVLDHLYTSPHLVAPSGTSGAGLLSDAKTPSTFSHRGMDDLARHRSHDDRIRHLNEDWFGLGPDGNRQRPSAAVATGDWWNWGGDAEGIVRETLIRALEVSLGLPHDARGYGTTTGGVATDASPPNPWPKRKRRWPIQFFWICASPMFLGWVTWARFGKGRTEGVVTVILTTPGASNSWLTTKLTAGDNPLLHGSADYGASNDAAHPLDGDGIRGVWVVGHETTSYATAPKTNPRPQHGKWVKTDPGLFIGDGPLVVVQPSEEDGGVLPGGRTW
jgi:hypothetical protein